MNCTVQEAQSSLHPFMALDVSGLDSVWLTVTCLAWPEVSLRLLHSSCSQSWPGSGGRHAADLAMLSSAVSPGLASPCTVVDYWRWYRHEAARDKTEEVSTLLG